MDPTKKKKISDIPNTILKSPCKATCIHHMTRLTENSAHFNKFSPFFSPVSPKLVNHQTKNADIIFGPENFRIFFFFLKKKIRENRLIEQK